MGINNPTTINVSGSPALAGNVILTAGTGVTLSQVGNVITVSSTGGGGGVSSLNSLTGAIVIESPDGTISVGVSGSNVTIDVVDATSSQLGGIVLTGDLGNTATSPEVVSTHLSSPLPVNQGGTGTTTPSLVAGTGITITGTWPDQTIAASGGGGGASVPLWNYPAFSNGWAMNQTVAWDDGNMVGGTQNATYMVPFNLEI